MRIAIDIREIRSSQITGIGRFIRNFLDNLREDNKNNIYLLADGNTYTLPYEKLFNVIKVNSPFTLWYDQIIIPRIVQAENLDIFFSPYFKIPFSAECKKIITIHDLYFLKNNLRKGKDRLKPFVSYIRQAVKHADRIITVSEFTKGEIIAQFDVAENKIKVVYNGIDKIFRVVDRDEFNILKSKYNVNYKYILYVGNTKLHKNIKGLIQAYSLLDDKLKDSYKLVIVAKHNENFTELKNFVIKLSLADNINFLDFISDEDLVLFYNFAAVFVFPSFYEGFGFPPLEAMACGVPVIASSIASLKEVLGEGALFINPYDIKEISQKISDVLYDKEPKEMLKSKGIMQASKYDPVLFSRNLLEEIKEVF